MRSPLAEQNSLLQSVDENDENETDDLSCRTDVTTVKASNVSKLAKMVTDDEPPNPFLAFAGSFFVNLTLVSDVEEISYLLKKDNNFIGRDGLVRDAGGCADNTANMLHYCGYVAPDRNELIQGFGSVLHHPHGKETFKKAVDIAARDAQNSLSEVVNVESGITSAGGSQSAGNSGLPQVESGTEPSTRVAVRVAVAGNVLARPMAQGGAGMDRVPAEEDFAGLAGNLGLAGDALAGNEALNNDQEDMGLDVDGDGDEDNDGDFADNQQEG